MVVPMLLEDGKMVVVALLRSEHGTRLPGHVVCVPKRTFF
jgi:hypothetical protein